ncbi:GntR family transcriptional regulator [Microbacterium sp. JZ31]|uniref:GntR family transcriptional regulator n=1 Tax=Microbacterium sp. JZ31 TaxID=1906274 RepID=UPI0019341F78|nr:GntR family transcriptional regulator [Microbacterium sp. JZ31]
MLTTLEPLTTPSRLSDIVFDRIKDAIIAGSLAPGTAIKDTELAQQLGVSRMPIREALQRLARVGLIEVAASRFTRVTRVTPALVRETLAFARCHAVAVVGLAVPQLTPRDRRELARVIRQAEADIEAGRPALLATRRVYRRLAETAGNRFLAGMLADVEIAIERNLAHASADEAAAAHVRGTLQDLRTAIERGDAAAASDAASRQYSILPRDPACG